MRYGSSEILFNRVSIFDVLRNHEEIATKAPSTTDDNRLLNTPTDDLIDEIVRKCALDVPVLDRDGSWIESAEGPVAVRDYWSRGVEPGYTVQGTILRLSVPFTGDSNFFNIQPSTHNFNAPRAHVSNSIVTIGYSAAELNPEQARTELNRSIDTIEQHLVWLRQSTEPFNQKISAIARAAVEARKAKVLRDRNSVAALGFNLKPRPDAPKTFCRSYYKKAGRCSATESCRPV
jgi:hypothetical protein